MGFINTPEERDAAIARNEMTHDAENHKFIRVMESMDLEQLWLVRKLLYAAASNANVGQFYIGMVTQRMNEMGQCSACDKNHDETLTEST